MKNQWLSFITGRVLVKVDGRGIERLINRLAQSGLIMWKVRKRKNGAVLFYIALPDLHKFRNAARKVDCSITFIRGEGLPFLWRRAIKNSGFLIGIVLFFLIAFILSNITWGIEIKGADPETEHKMRKELTHLGIKVGSLHLLNDKPDVIQQKLTEKIDNITWIGVELKGTTFHFNVVQKNEPKKPELKSPSHLVAKKKAIIADVFVEKGKSMVKINQYVEKGQLLVSGVIGNEAKPKLVSATGEVWGITWYNTKVEFPLKSNFKVYSGEEIRRHYVVIGKLKLPFWGFKKVDFKQYEIDTIDHDLYFLGWKLPIVYSERTIRENENLPRSLTKEEAIEAAKELARRDLENNIPAEARVDGEYILQQEVDNGKVKISINFQVIENIAEERPIIQGD
ncbi:sporulation protein YqfD [Bacillus sp. FJAT-49732]|uniref:Sporulation protein YqfD n=1 Tax=Lederbergia citrisecunda TaxID=2833583 RepID=A0A942YKJ7_9BACI|nr:sporulation protein YqfD [Lederbergia citrisecunda]MBS4199712.1 sporulation protein YqfD [Lederbergia citrisecunda]